ncbi:hypothetical protein CK203_014355 [Vitis vinifera]|uniref:Uncharacterized protein n=1 Tax=Vitis vinifera TaxID=29760 RepID=A0A438K4Z9_VITVI|nr:hypothetical protein CK203_014355 [Vitis vinifera]
MSPKERFNLSAHISSLQFITELSNSSKGWTKGHVLVSGPWSGSTKGPNKFLKPTRSLEIPSKDKWGHLVEWVKKSSFAHFNNFFEIDKSERSHIVLHTEKNLRVVISQAKQFVILLLPRLAPPSLVSCEHFVLKNLPFYKVARLADAKARQTRLDAREKKTLRRDFAPSP